MGIQHSDKYTLTYFLQKIGLCMVKIRTAVRICDTKFVCILQIMKYLWSNNNRNILMDN